MPFLAKRNTEHDRGLGRLRWVVERTFAWLNQFRRLHVRYEKRADIREGFLSLGCILICWRFLAARNSGEQVTGTSTLHSLTGIAPWIVLAFPPLCLSKIGARS
jgi:Transposase DDE domain